MRTTLALSIVLMLAGGALLIAGRGTTATTAGFAMEGVAGVLLVSLTFYLVGESEDRERAGRPPRRSL